MVHWLLALLYYQSRRRRDLLDHAHDTPSGDRRSLVVTPDVQRIREDFQREWS